MSKAPFWALNALIPSAYWKLRDFSGVTTSALVTSLVALASQLAVAEVVTSAIALEAIRAAATTPANTIFFILNFLRIIKLVPFMELLLQILIMTLSR